MQNYILIVWIFILVILTSCYQDYYPASTSASITPILKPHSKDSITDGHYINFSYQEGPVYFFYEDNKKFNFTYHYAITYESLSGGIGVMGFKGIYIADPPPINFLDGKKNYLGGGIKGEAFYNYTSGPVDWRFIGIKGGFTFERGEFPELRRAVYQYKADNPWREDILHGISKPEHDNSVTIAMASEASLKIEEGHYLHGGVHLGVSGNIKLQAQAGASFIYFYHPFGIYIQRITIAQTSGPLTSLGIIYKFY